MKTIAATQDKRPEWPFEEMTEHDFRAIHEFGQITSVKSQWQFTGVDTSDEWLEVGNAKGSLRLPKSWRSAYTFVGLSLVPGLFELTHLGERMWEQLKKIDEWEVANAQDRREYERLRAKFGQS